MRYLSTRDNTLRNSAAEVIIKGLSADGGLFTPEVLPNLSANSFENMRDMSYHQRAVYIMKSFLDDFTYAEINSFSEKAYGGGKFDCKEITPVRAVGDNTYFLELWHGPTGAFKDMALQMLPHLLTNAMEKTDEMRDACILVATSGDTGKAALQGFCDIPRTKIIVFYPQNGVSAVQELQMVTQNGNNVTVCAVKGNFDDAQTGVKAIFSNQGLNERIEDAGYFLSSANSINWGRVLPQIVYYVSAYCDLLKQEAVEPGGKINVCVPTGNFGNILSAYYAKQMGLPIEKLICASNRNNVLTELINSGVYNKNRKFYNTLSPSMDILVSSNLERLIFEFSDNDDSLIKEYMRQLQSSGGYEVNAQIRSKFNRMFHAGYCDDERTLRVISEVYNEHSYLIDPHTAVAYDVLAKYRASSGDDTPAIIAATASPFKFCGSVLTALGKPPEADGVELIDRLSELTGIEAPHSLGFLKDKSVRFDRSVAVENMAGVIFDALT